MKIIEIVSQTRRDFRAIVECEACGAKQDLNGYDDRHYHDNVVPKVKCKQCGKSRNDLGIVDEPTSTRYADNEVV